MIITLKGADFSASNIGTLTTWSIFTTLGSGATYSGVTIVDRGASFSGAVSIDEGYEIGSAGVKVTMGGTTLNDSVTINGNTITISISSVTGTVNISVPTKNVATGEEDDGGDVTVPSGATLVTTGSLKGAFFYERAVLEGASNKYTGVTVDQQSAYFVYDKIPVPAGCSEITLVNGRAYFFSDNTGSAIMTNQGNLTSGAVNFTVAVPTNAAYITVAFKYDEIQPSAVELITAHWGTPTTTLLKDTEATYMAEHAIVSATNSPDGYTQPQEYAGYFTYHLIPVTGGNKYIMENCRLSNWYDSNKTFISQVNFNITQTKDWSRIAPNNAAYLTVCINNNDSTKDTVAMIEYPRG